MKLTQRQIARLNSELPPGRVKIEYVELFFSRPGKETLKIRVKTEDKK